MKYQKNIQCFSKNKDNIYYHEKIENNGLLKNNQTLSLLQSRRGICRTKKRML